MIWFFNKKDKKDDKAEKETENALEIQEVEAFEDNPAEAPIGHESVDTHTETDDTPDLSLENNDLADETIVPTPAEAVQEAMAAADDGIGTDDVIEEDPAPQSEAEDKKGWLSRLTSGLSKSSGKMTENITAVLTKRKLDDETLEELEEALIVSDLGPTTAAKLTAELARTRFGKDVTDVEIRAALAQGITEILTPVARPLAVGAGHPHVILFAGVNGTGKTTTIGKLAKRFTEEGKTVMLAAGDTFRAAAVEQLKVWGDRTGCHVVAKDIGADAGALAYEAMAAAREANVDVLLVDTAGRLQNKSNLMDELQKVVRVIRKQDETAPHQTILVLDATTGQNAHSQVDLFDKAVNVSGLVVTKLDGTAKGGVIVSLAEKYGKPIHAIGVGEKAEDLRHFQAEDFAKSLMGVE